jgi:hypothetical protein
MSLDDGSIASIARAKNRRLCDRQVCTIVAKIEPNYIASRNRKGFFAFIIVHRETASGFILRLSSLGNKLPSPLSHRSSVNLVFLAFPQFGADFFQALG